MSAMVESPLDRREVVARLLARRDGLLVITGLGSPTYDVHAAGAWLGGKRSVLLLQSSGVGNCINMLSLMTIARFPLLMLVTMRGEWAEFNPWQVPMGLATAPVLTAMGIRVMRAETPRDLIETVESAATLAYEAEQQVAVLLSQRLLGAKKW